MENSFFLRDNRYSGIIIGEDLYYERLGEKKKAGLVTLLRGTDRYRLKKSLERHVNQKQFPSYLFRHFMLVFADSGTVLIFHTKVYQVFRVNFL